MSVSKSIKILLDADKNELERFLFREFTEDAQGNLLNETEFNNKGEVVYRKTLNYFDDGVLRELVEFDPHNNLIERRIFHRNQDELVDCIHFEYGFGTKIIEEYSFTDLGNAQKVVSKDEDGEILETIFYIWNDENLVITELYLDNEDEETKRTEFSYDDQNLLISEKQIVEGDLVEIKEYQYDELERVARIDFSTPKESVKSFETYTYNEHGNLAHLQAFTNGVLTFDNICKYSEDGKLIEEEYFQLDYWKSKIVHHERIIHEYA